LLSILDAVWKKNAASLALRRLKGSPVQASPVQGSLVQGSLANGAAKAPSPAAGQVASSVGGHRGKKHNPAPNDVLTALARQAKSESSPLSLSHTNR